MAAILAAVRSNARFFLILCGGVLGITLIVAAVQFQTIVGGLAGPHYVALADLSTPRDWEYVTTSGGRLVPAWDTITTTTSRRSGRSSSSISSRWYLLLDDKSHRILVVQSGEESENVIQTGVVTTLSQSERDQVEKVIREAGASTEILARLQPVKLEARNAAMEGLWWLLGLLAVGGLSGYGTVRFLRFYTQPMSHPQLGRAAKQPWWPQFQAALESPSRHTQLGKLMITPVALFHLDPPRLIAPDDLLWAYGHVTEQRTTDPKSPRRTHQLALALRDGTVLLVAVPGENPAEIIAGLLGWIERQFPWVFVGYAAETEQQFKKQRRRLIEQVAARRREAEAPAPARPLTPSLSESANS